MPVSIVDAPSDSTARDSESEAAHQALIEFLYRVPLGLVETTLDGTIVMVNPKCAQLLVPLCDDGDLENLFDVLSTFVPDIKSMVANFDAPAGVVCDPMRFEVDTRPGFAALTLSMGITKLASNRFMTVLSDVTADADRERTHLSTQLRQATRVDPVTSMPNRSAVIEGIQTVLDRAPTDVGYEFALLFIACDRFKQLNDSFGHDVGNEVIVTMAGRLKASLRQTDSIAHEGGEILAARVGDDEFVVLIEGARDSPHAPVIADRLVDALSRPYLLPSHEIHINVGIGITGRRHAPRHAEDLLRDASLAASCISTAGNGRCAVFEPEMREQALSRRLLEQDLRAALAANEFFVVYQPVVGLGNRSRDAGATGVEALVRWRHATRGVVPPNVFIGIAEETGLIDALGEFVMSTACRQFVEWTERLPGELQHLAVNVSRAQLASPDFVGKVGAIIKSTRMDPRRLQLEITESLAAQDERIQKRLHELKALGVSIALDDFGTGYSSLSSLHLLPVDVVKIDRSFVTLAESSAHHRVLIEATIRVARSLGMRTVAEGIETPSQASIVDELGCDKAQGYLYSRPLPADAVAPWLRERLDASMSATGA